MTNEMCDFISSPWATEQTYLTPPVVFNLHDHLSNGALVTLSMFTYDPVYPLQCSYFSTMMMLGFHQGFGCLLILIERNHLVLWNILLSCSVSQLYFEPSMRCEISWSFGAVIFAYRFTMFPRKVWVIGGFHFALYTDKTHWYFCKCNAKSLP